MKTVFSYARPYKIPIIIALCLTFLELSVELIQPLLIAKIIDDGITAHDSSVVITWGSIMMGLAVLAFVSGIVNSYFSAHVAQSFAYDVRSATFRHLQKMTLATFLTFQSSSLITRLTNDVTIIQNFLFMSLRIMTRAPLVVIGSLMMAFFVNVQLALLLLVTAPFLAIFLWVMVKQGVSIFASVQRRLDRVNRMAQENLRAMRLVKAYLRHAFETSRFNRVAEALQKDTVRALRTMELILPVLLFVMNASLMAVLWFGAKQIQTSSIQVGELVAVLNYGLRMTGAFSMFSFLIMIFSRAKASSERIEEVLVVESLEDVKRERDDIPHWERLRFHDGSFSYKGSDRQALRNINFELKRGETLAIMGATGSGKSTLVQLIPRLFTPTSGEIVLGEQPLQRWSLSQLRELIGYVPQQSLLFTGTIADNLRWGAPHATDDELIEATTNAQIHDAIQAFPNGYDTVIGQKGVNLSGGQKQRISIARALIRKPELLILDDSTSALDIQTEQQFLNALQTLDVTTIIITQKVMTAERADAILLLEDGQVVDYGTSEQLAKRSALYQRLIASQKESEGKEDE
ncbi:ABC transporter ATP-binding protein [Savagea sp. SN6]|uniref:ABC transporter ATP-binding protein n=1 Tax=Savagea serpentis TaxID=2785297 RepID=A0A8J7G3C9_9BACL|nr:ABC transporter ATP-binding protein [Savagea serpentis]MBF4501490.1 ABC transporter ATP-binding protein [Savagea serpentis]